MKNNHTHSKKKTRILFWISVTCLLSSLVLICYFIIEPVNGQYNADSTDTLLWAEAVYESGTLVNHEFYYASVLPFGGHLLMVPFIGIFGVSLTAHIAGMLLFFLLLTAAFIGLFRALRWSWTEAFFYTSLSLLLLASGKEMIRNQFEHIIYYSLGTLFLLVGLNIMIRMMTMHEHGIASNKQRSKLSLLAIGLLLWFFLTSLNGGMSMVFFCGPCFMAYAGERLLESSWRLDTCETKRELAFFICLAFAASAGLVLGKRIIGDSAGEYGQYFSTFSTQDQWGANLNELLSYWISTWQDYLGTRSPILTKAGLVTSFNIMIALFMAICPFVGLIKYRQLSTRANRLIVLAFFAMFAFNAFTSVFGMIGGRLTALHNASIVCVLVLLRHFIISGSIIHKRVALLSLSAIVAFGLLCGVSLVRYPSDYRNQNKYFGVVDFLDEHGLDYGYATSWNSRVPTVLSASKIQVHPIVIDPERQQIRIDHYQSFVHWFQAQEGQSQYFLMLTADEYEQIIQAVPEDYAEVLYYEEFLVFVYDRFPFPEWDNGLSTAGRTEIIKYIHS